MLRTMLRMLPPELNLRGGAADLGDYGGRYRRNDPCFQPDPVLGPGGSGVAVRGHQDARVIHHRCHADCRSGWSAPALPRAACSSSRVKAPCSSSHSETAASPSRTMRARRAAAVIQADTLTPSAAAAATTWAWTSASTVIADQRAHRS